MAGIIAPTNFARATLASPPVGAGGLAFTVAAGKGALFPNPGAGEWFYGAFTNAARSKFEIVKIEARVGDGLTIAAGTRGSDGTVADTWLAGDIFYLPTTRAMWLETAFAVIMLALAKLTPAADKIAYFTSATAAALTDFTAYARTLVAAANAAAARVVLDVFSKSETWSTGDAKLTFKAVADAGWVLANDGSIGNAASGGTTRANADTEALFTLLWTNVTNAWAPTQDSAGVPIARGANAAADFAANRRLVLPKNLGRAIAVAGAGAGLTARALGESLGAETHQLTANEMPQHDHTIAHTHNFTSTNGATAGAGSIGGNFLVTSGYVGGLVTEGSNTPNSGTAGGSVAHNNMGPTSFMNAMIKL